MVKPGAGYAADGSERQRKVRGLAFCLQKGIERVPLIRKSHVEGVEAWKEMEKEQDVIVYRPQRLVKAETCSSGGEEGEVGPVGEHFGDGVRFRREGADVRGKDLPAGGEQGPKKWDQVGCERGILVQLFLRPGVPLARDSRDIEYVGER